MNRSLLSGISAFALLACNVPASAEGIYASGSLGGSWLKGTLDLPDNLGPNFDIAFSPGFAGTAALGFLLGSGWRLEAEGGVQNGTLGAFTRIDPAPCGSCNEGVVAGTATIFTLMANGWYDFNVGGGFRPYVGGGAGLAHVGTNISETGNGSTANGSQWVFAFQLGAGVGYAVSDAVTLSFDYRYLQTQGVSIPFNRIGEQGSVNGPFQSHSAMVGMRYNFGPHSIGAR